MAATPDETILAQELEATAEAFDDAVKTNDNLLKQLSTKEDVIVKLHAEKSKLEALLRAKERELADASKPPELNGWDLSTAEQLAKLREKDRSMSMKLATLERDLTQKQNAADYYKRKLSESSRQHAKSQANLDQATKSLDEVYN